MHKGGIALRNLHSEPGCIYDTVTFLINFLTESASGSIHKGQLDNNYYKDIKDNLSKDYAILPYYLYPFVCRHKDRPPFLYSVIYDNQLYSKCTYRHAMTILENQQYFRRRYVEYYFEPSDQSYIFKNVEAHPSGVELIKRQAFEPALEMYMYYSLIRYAEVVKELISIFQSLYAEIFNKHNEFLAETPEFIRSFQSSETVEKLKILGNSNNDSFNFSLTLMEPNKLWHSDKEPNFFLLGYKYEDSLETRYKYLTANPYAFAQAIGNPVRYEIYQALLIQSPMTRADMEKKLHLSRSALDHNINIMRDKGLLIIDHQSGLSNYYRLDPEYIRVTAGLMLEGLHSP